MNRFILIPFVIIPMMTIHFVNSREYSRCELAQTLLSFQPNIYYDDLNHWMCIIQKTNLNSSSIITNEKSVVFHGIFQLSNQFACADTDIEIPKRLCEVICDQYVDDYVLDDFECAQTIFSVEAEKSGNGFNAWPTADCQNDVVIDWIYGCYIDNILAVDLIVRDKGKATIEPRK